MVFGAVISLFVDLFCSSQSLLLLFNHTVLTLIRV